MSKGQDYSKPEPLDELGYDGELPAPPPKRERGCLFYGCLFSLALAFLVLVALVLASWMAYRWTGRMVATYTDVVPEEIAVTRMADLELKNLTARVNQFARDVRAGREARLALSAEQLNALIADQPELRGKVSLSLAGDKIEGKISLPLGNLELPGWFLGGLEGRYLNGAATLMARVENGALVVHLDDLSVRDRKVPGEIMAALRRENLARDALNDPDVGEVLGRLRSVEVKDGFLILSTQGRKALPGEPGEKPADPDKPPAAEREVPGQALPAEAPLPAPAEAPNEFPAPPFAPSR